MSDRLATSSALSVLLMASYVLFGGDARQASLGPGNDLLPRIAAPSVLLQPSALLPR